MYLTDSRWSRPVAAPRSAARRTRKIFDHALLFLLLAAATLAPVSAAAAQQETRQEQTQAQESEQAGLRATAIRMGAPGLVAPVLLETRLPEYTEAARAAGIEGDVYVEAVVTAEGTVADPVLVRGLPDDELNRRALDALSQWTFEPGTRDDEAVNVLALFTVTFRVS